MKNGIINGVHNGIIPQYNKIVTRGSIVAKSNRVGISYTNLVCWLKADSLITLNGSTVSINGDASGTNNNATQSVAILQPSYIVDSGGLVNNMPAINYDGSDDCMELLNPINSNNYSIFIVAKLTKPAQNTNAYMLGNASPDADLLGWDDDLYGIRIRGGNSGGGFFSTPTANIVRNITNTYEIIISSNIATQYVNEVATGGTVTLSNNFVIKYIGAFYSNLVARNFGGYIHEIIIYNAVLSTTERQRVEFYLKSKYQHYV